MIHAALAETSEGDPVARPVAALVTEERPPLPVGHLRLSESHLFGVSILCFERERWQLSQRAVTAFELTPDAEAQVNQALGELKTEIFRMEAERVEKHSDWHYTVGAFSKEEVKSLRAGFRSHLDNHLEAIQAEALTALAFNHDYFLKDGLFLLTKGIYKLFDREID